jgi:hypothetical protein
METMLRDKDSGKDPTKLVQKKYRDFMTSIE